MFNLVAALLFAVPPLQLQPLAGFQDAHGVVLPSVYNYNLTLASTKKLCYGSTCQYWMVYNFSGTQFDFYTTNSDGSGTDFLLLTVEDGTRTLSLGGNGTDARLIFQTTATATQQVLIKSIWSGSEAYLNLRAGDDSTSAGVVGRWFYATTAGIAFSSQGGGNYAQGSGAQYVWSDNANGSAGSIDTGFKRLSAGVISATNGGSGEGGFAAPANVKDVGATCNKGEVLIDTGGATVEICVCTATNTLRCVSTTGSAPAD